MRGRTPRDPWTEVNGRTMFARAWDAAAPPDRLPVVLVHGLALSSAYFLPVAERLVCDFPVFAPDLPGFGRSEVPDGALDIPQLAEVLATWMDGVGLGRVALVAHSFGCPVAVALALQPPERVARLVLADPAVDPGARTSWQQIRRMARDLPRTSPSYAALLARGLRRAGVRRTWHTLQFMLRDHLEEKLPRVRAPSLVVRGSRDAIVSQDWAERAAELVPDGRLVVVPGAPHPVPFAAPGEFARIVRRFLLESDDRRA